MLNRTEFAYSQVKNHINSLNGKLGGSIPVENYLVQYLLISFYSEMEERIGEIIRNRLSFEGDLKLQSFVYATNEAMIRRVKKREIKDILKQFGCSDDELFDGVTEAEVSFYSAAIANRHRIAHKEGASVTLTQFERALEAAKKILRSVEECIE